MARLSDLTPEVRLKIYRLLLVDPIQQGLRIAFLIEPTISDRILCHREHCIQDDLPHEADHSAHSCRIDAMSPTIHHFDFTDLMSLAMVNRTLYIEASQTIYNNFDLSLSNHKWLLLRGKFAPAPELLHRYLVQHCSATRDMIPSLVIHDGSAAMSPRDAKSIVDLANTQLPKLRAFDYHVITRPVGSLGDLLQDFLRNHARAIRNVQPFVDLKAGVRKALDLPIPTRLRSLGPQLDSSLCRLGQQFAEEIPKMALQMREHRRLVKRHHTLALDRGRYLRVTLALRSMPDMDAGIQFEKEIPGFAEVLAISRDFSVAAGHHRELLRVARKAL